MLTTLNVCAPATDADETAGGHAIGRRAFVAGAVAVLAGLATQAQGAQTMYGLIGKMTTTPGQRDAMLAILLEGIGGMPGCLSYVVAKDAGDPDGIWITEVWDSKESHDASLSLPAVKAAIARGRPLIASFGSGVTTEPVGGQGLPNARP